jgi:TP901 family phage tail tape measure protein
MVARSSGGGLYFDAGVDISKLKAGFAKGRQEARNFASGVVREGRRVDQAFNQSSRGVNVMNTSLGNVKNSLLPLVGLAGGAGLMLILANQVKQAGQETYNFSKDFEMAMKEVSTISAAVRADFKGISEEIINMAAQGPDDAIQLANAYYQIVSAGYDGVEGLELLRVSSEAATAGITDTKTAADGITTVLNAWGKSFDEAELVADAMFKTVEKGKTTFPELASNIAQVAPVAATLKIPFEEIMALIASITKQGTTTSMAFTQIRSALVGLSKQMGGDIFQQGESLQEVFEDIAQGANYSIEELTKLTGRVEGASAILATTGEKFASAKDDLNELAGAAGSMTSAYDEMMEAVENKWSLVHNKWNRELKSLGNNLKLASGGLADFFDELLTNRQADIIDPAVNSQLKRFKAELSGIEDIEARRAAIQEKIFEIRKKQSSIGEEKFQLEKQQPGSVRKGVEWLNMATGMNKVFGDAVISGHVKEKELEIVKEQFDINRKLEKELMAMFKASFSETGTEIDEPDQAKEKIKTLSDYQKEIEQLKEKLGTGPIEQDVQLILKIANLNEKADEIKTQVREKLKEALGDNLEIKPLENLSATIAKTSGSLVDIDKEMSKILKGSTTLTKEEEQRLKMLVAQSGELIKQEALIEALQEGFESTSEILGAVSYALGEVDMELGRSVGKMADLAYNASTLIGQLASQNYVGAIATGIGMLGNVFGMFNKQEDPIAQNLETINRTLERQSAILASMPDLEGYYNVAQKQLQKFNEEVDLLNEKLKQQAPQYSVPTYNRYAEEYDSYLQQMEEQIFNRALGMGYRPGTNEIEAYIREYMSQLPSIDEYIAENFPLEYPVSLWDADDIISEWAKGNVELSEDALETVREINAVKAEMQRLLDDQYQKALGFSTGNVAESIVSGIEEGLRLSESGLGDWTQNFGELMRKALRQNLLSALNEQLLVNFMAEFNEAMKDGDLDGDVDSLRESFIAAVEQAESIWETISPVLDEYTQGINQQGLTGAIQGITEETASLIAGQFTAMRFDLKDISTSLNEMIDYSMDSLNFLEDIAENTSENYRLKAIEEKLTEMNGYLRDAV